MIVAVIVVFDYFECTYISFIILSFCFIQITQKSEIIIQKTNETRYLSCCDVKIGGGFDLDPGIPGKLIDLKNKIYSPVKIDKCRLCKYNYTAETHSSSRDLAVFISMGESQGIVPRIRSLRTAGCKAKILLLTDSNRSFPEDFVNCGIDIVTLKLSKWIDKDQIIMMRYIIISDILKNYGSAFDRVLYCDGFDTYFQYDPFINVSKDPYALHVSPERFLHMSSPWSRMWAQDMTGLDFDKFFGRHQIYCAGVFMGGVKAMEMINGLVGSSVGRDFQMVVNDQIFFDWIFLTQIPKILNITVIENYNLASIHFTNGDYDNAEIGKMCYKHTDLCPAVLHQINRRSELEVKFSKVCK